MKISKENVEYMISVGLKRNDIEKMYNIGLKNNFVLKKLKEINVDYTNIQIRLFKDMILCYQDWLEIPDYSGVYIFNKGVINEY